MTDPHAPPGPPPRPASGSMVAAGRDDRHETSARLARRTLQGRVFAALLGLLGALPLRGSHAVGAALGGLFSLFPNRQRRVAGRNLAWCFPELGRDECRRLRRRTLVAAGRGLAELGWFWRRPAQASLGRIRAVHGKAHLDAALAAGRGVLLAAPHLGAWELLCQYLASRGPLTVLYREPRDAGVEAVINAGRGRLGAELVRAGPSGVRRLYRALAEGRIVGILPDQQPKRGQGVFAPFFGVPALTMVLFSRLARKADCPVLLGWAERLPRGAGYELHFVRLPEAVASGELEASVAALNATIEVQVRRRPEQYQWGYKRFSIQPPGANRAY